MTRRIILFQEFFILVQKISLFRKKKFKLNKMFQQNALEFSILYVPNTISGLSAKSSALGKVQ